MTAEVSEKASLGPARSAWPKDRPSGLSATLTSVHDPADFKLHVGDGAHLVFQGPHWLVSWASVLQKRGVSELYWMSLRDGAGEHLMGFPLALRETCGLRILEIPDGGVSDYIGPVFHRRARFGPMPCSREIWRTLKAALPPADLFRIEGLKSEVAGLHNPLVDHALVQESRLIGLDVVLPEKWDDYFASLSTRMRDHVGKSRRRFLRQPGTRMAIAQSGAEALGWLEHLDRMQRERLVERGSDIRVTSAEFSEFYKVLAAGGIERGEVVMGALFAHDEVIAINYAVRCGDHATYLRLSNLFGPWSPMSPGLVATEHIIRQLHERGVRVFDFGMGDYDYKRRFGGKPFPLYDLDLPLSWRGVPAAVAAYTRRALRQVGWLRRLTGRNDIKPCRAKAAED